MSIQPRLTRFDLSMIVISLVIGMGIFGSPSDVAVKAGNTWIFFGAWIFGGVVTLCGALTFAEIGARYPATGGFYKVFSYCYHPAFAFMINWVLVISNAASVAAVALLGAEYINPILLPASFQNATGTKLTTIATVLVLYVINFLGIKLSARAQNVLSIFKVVAILILCTAIFKSDATPKAAIAALPANYNMVTAFGLSLVAVFFTYGGYQQTINFGGDIIDAKRNIPKAVFVGIGTVIVLYLAINYAYYAVLGLGGLQQTRTLAAHLAGVIFGATGYKITSILMFVSVLAYVNVNILANPRVYYAMAEDGILPSIFKRVNQRTQVQEFGMSFFVAAALVILFFVGSFSEMLKYVMFFDTIGLSLAAVAIFILRKKTRDMDTSNIYTIKLFPLIPLVFIIAYWFVTINIFITFKDDPYAALWCLAAYVLGLGIYYIGARNKKTASPDN
ncbi:amino acid permease [Mucilaginibacter pallidiroseus]|uniref:Amino acid permease n=1 Tax=Mucilaginibacter pallidiroseus TaxID=2599295 RepID=A0A563U7L8_9SPHI|nr:amino acid permease [Mucilaginibacter pallidiroseus]TWR27340.1 amino acid permease [Mucilaginibacter pallidiroseus]